MSSVIAGCGGGDKKAATTAAVSAPVPTQTAPPQTATAPAPTTPAPSTSTPPVTPPPTTSPVPGGSEPARTELTFTASRAGIKPRHASVAPYVAVKVTLASKDGSSHTLTIGGKRLKVGGTRRSAFVTLPGLRPGATYKGRVDGGTTVRILSSAEPGP